MKAKVEYYIESTSFVITANALQLSSKLAGVVFHGHCRNARQPCYSLHASVCIGWFLCVVRACYERAVLC